MRWIFIIGFPLLAAVLWLTMLSMAPGQELVLARVQGRLVSADGHAPLEFALVISFSSVARALDANAIERAKTDIRQFSMSDLGAPRGVGGATTDAHGSFSFLVRVTGPRIPPVATGHRVGVLYVEDSLGATEVVRVQPSWRWSGGSGGQPGAICELGVVQSSLSP